MTVWQKISGVVTAVGTGGSAILQRLAGSSPPADASASPERSVTFTIAMIALAAKMAKADGIVSPIEVEAFRRIIKTPVDQTGHVDRLFLQAQQDIAGYGVYADQIRAALKDDRRLLRDVLESLFHIASADRAIHPAESIFLETVARHFKLSDSEFRHVRALFVNDAGSPYDILGLDPSASDDALKKRHRRLVRENHPDLAIARGVPAEMIDAATRKLAAINAAYATVCAERGL
jgi:DnaJ like chaperone protein